MVKLAFNSPLAQKDVKKEDENSEVLIIPENKVSTPPLLSAGEGARDVSRCVRVLKPGEGKGHVT